MRPRFLGQSAPPASPPAAPRIVPPEQAARDLLERLGVRGAQSYTAGDLVELANLIANARAVSSFVVGYWPGLEDGIDWPDDGTHPAIVAARALAASLWRRSAPATTEEEKRE